MKKGTILLSDDSSLSALVLSGILRGKIEQLDFVRNIKELIQHYQSKHYDLILLHTWLNQSLKVMKEIRKHEVAVNCKFTPIIGIFAEWRGDKAIISAEYQKYFDAGMSEILLQPLAEEDINKILEKYIL